MEGRPPPDLEPQNQQEDEEVQVIVILRLKQFPLECRKLTDFELVLIYFAL